MLKHIKLTTISRLFTIMMLFTCIILGLGTLFLERNISLVSSTWSLFQTDRSEKARLESALRSAIGYGGMIHEFKNYVLRHEPGRLKHIQSDMGAARAIIDLYRDQDITTAESVALDDIEKVLDQYTRALLQTRELIKQGRSIGEIDVNVKVDDSPALRGLQTLRSEVRQSIGPDTPLSKARISADLRTAIGYGGMIHEFKNYVLRHDAERVEKINEKLEQARGAIAQYRQLEPTKAEALALEDIEQVLLNYDDKIQEVSQMIVAGAEIAEIDRVVQVDDSSALRGLRVLDKEIARQITSHGNNVSKALALVEQTLNMGTWGVIILLLVVAFSAVWLIQQQIIAPILRLTSGMNRLANNDLSVTLDNEYRDNELGEMSRTVMLFKANIIERDEAERLLSEINRDQEEQIETIRKLRENADQQADKALNLADGLAAARESAESAMARAEQEELRVRSILNAVHDAIFTINTQGIIETANPAALQIFGYRLDEMVGNNVSMLMPDPVHSRHNGYIARFVEGSSKRDISDPAEQTALHKRGHTFTVNVTLNTIEIDQELKIIGVIRDITERKKWEEEIQRLAMTDPLTGLANRNHYNQRLEETAALSRRSEQPFALLLIDLDKFKPVNDTYGHPVGDALLEHVAQMLLNNSRDVDTVARLGGDEFAVILMPTEHGLDIDTPAQRIIKALSEPVTIDGHTIQIGASIGISTFPDHSDNLENLQSQADRALYLAKEGGRNTYRIFEADSESQS